MSCPIFSTGNATPQGTTGKSDIALPSWNKHLEKKEKQHEITSNSTVPKLKTQLWKFTTNCTGAHPEGNWPRAQAARLFSLTELAAVSQMKTQSLGTALTSHPAKLPPARWQKTRAWPQVTRPFGTAPRGAQPAFRRGTQPPSSPHEGPRAPQPTRLGADASAPPAPRACAQSGIAACAARPWRRLSRRSACRYLALVRTLRNPPTWARRRPSSAQTWRPCGRSAAAVRQALRGPKPSRAAESRQRAARGRQRERLKIPERDRLTARRRAGRALCVAFTGLRAERRNGARLSCASWGNSATSCQEWLR